MLLLILLKNAKFILRCESKEDIHYSCIECHKMIPKDKNVLLRINLDNKFCCCDVLLLRSFYKDD